MLLSAEDGAVRYDFKFWATPLPSVKDWRKAFDWPTEGENFLVWAVVTATNTGPKPAEAKLVVERLGPKASPPQEFAWRLKPSASAEAVIRAPFAAVEDPAAFDKEDPKVWLQRTVDYWKGVVAGAARIEVPCRKATEALLAAHVCQLIASDHGELHGGEGFYDHFYIRDGAYQIMELEEAGLSDAAAKAIEPFLRCQAAGRAVREPDEGTRRQRPGRLGVLAILEDHRRSGLAGEGLSADSQGGGLDRSRPAARRRADSPYAGLLAGRRGRRRISVGRQEPHRRLRLLEPPRPALHGRRRPRTGQNRRGGRFAQGSGLLSQGHRRGLEANWALPYFPPSWEKAGTHWGNTETLWPTPIFSPDDPRVAALIDEVRHRHGGGYVEGTIRWLGCPDAIHPYMGAYTTMADLVRGNDEQVVEDFYWYLLHSTAAHAFPEGILFKTRTAWSDTIPHVTGAANYAVMLRHMLVHEAGDELHLLRAVPDWWLAEGRQIRGERLPTHFGPMSLLVQGTKHGVEIKLDPPKRNPPKRIVLHLPQSRPLAAALDGVEVDAAARPGETLGFSRGCQRLPPDRFASQADPLASLRSDNHETTRIPENRDWGLGRLWGSQSGAAFGLRRPRPEQPHQRGNCRPGEPKPGRSACLPGTGRRPNRSGLRRQHGEPRLPDAQAVPRPQAGAGRRERLLCQEDQRRPL